MSTNMNHAAGANDGIVLIPLSSLVKSNSNVRKGDAGDVSGLAASIRVNGLLHPLLVVPQGRKFAVAAGWRRTLALRMLVADGTFEKDHQVECRVVDSSNALEVSTAENELRQQMHPADQYDAFRAMVDAGKAIPDVAASFGVTPAVVLQRLKLANVSPRLLEAFRADKLTLAQMMAFAICDDHETQVSVWKAAEKSGHWDMQPAQLRERLTQGEVRVSRDQRARYVGIEAYEKAGGSIRRDLFSAENDVYFMDPVLLDRLAAEKLEKKAAKVRKEGWGWVDVRPTCDHSELYKFGRLNSTRRPYTAAEKQALAALSAESGKLCTEERELEELDPVDGTPEAARLDAIQDRLEAIKGQCEAIDSECVVNDETLRAHAGALIFISNGVAKVERGLLRPEDKKAIQRHLAADVSDREGGQVLIEREPTEKLEISEALQRRLTAQRTAAARAVLASSHEVALAALVHAFAAQEFYQFTGVRTPLNVSARDDAALGSQDREIGESRAMQEMDARRREIEQLVPVNPRDLMAWAIAQPISVLLNVLAYCVANSLNLVQGKSGSQTASGCPLDVARVLTNAAGLNMADWWEANSSTYFASISKAKIVAAVSEACGNDAAEPLVKFKKAEAAEAAEKLVEGRHWLPEVLR